MIWPFSIDRRALVFDGLAILVFFFALHISRIFGPIDWGVLFPGVVLTIVGVMMGLYSRDAAGQRLFLARSVVAFFICALIFYLGALAFRDHRDNFFVFIRPLDCCS